MITVINNASKDIDVAINQWGTGGDTEFSTINASHKGTWNRSDDRGFAMAVKIGSTTKNYIVFHDSNIIVTNNEVKRDGEVI